jgi:hypothetical protein
MYPPPPPLPGQATIKAEANYHPRPAFNPYEYNHPHIPYQIEPDHHQRRPSDIQPETKRPRLANRHPSDEDEREAGLALAGLGLSTTPTGGVPRLQSVPESEISQGPNKRQRAKAVTKKNDRGSEPGRAQNACKECRRLKAKCDKQIPCSTCKRHRLDKAE